MNQLSEPNINNEDVFIAVAKVRNFKIHIAKNVMSQHLIAKRVLMETEERCWL